MEILSKYRMKVGIFEINVGNFEEVWDFNYGVYIILKIIID